MISLAGVLLKKLNYLSETKDKIKEAITKKDVIVEEGTTFREYANIIDKNCATVNIAFGDTAPDNTDKIWVNAGSQDNIKIVSKNSYPNLLQKFDSLEGYIPTPTIATVGKKIYFFGGLDGSGSYVDWSIDNSVRVYDTETRTYTKLDVTIPYKCTGSAVAAVGTKIYLFGGRYITSQSKYGISYGYYNKIQVFDTDTNTFTTLSTKLPTASDSISAGVVGSKIYLFGGFNNSTVLSTINIFDTQTNTIATASTSMHDTVSGCAVAVYGSKIYLFGAGETSYWITLHSYTTDVIYVYDTENNTYNSITTTFPESFLDGVCAYDEKYAYIAHSGYLDKIYKFNLQTETFEDFNVDLLHGSLGFPLAMIGSQLFVLGRAYYEQKYTVSIIDTASNAVTYSDPTLALFTTANTQLPVGLYRFGAEKIGNYIYILGGCSGEQFLSTIYKYDVVNDTIMTCEATLPLAISDFGTAAVGDIIYIFGGTDGTTKYSTILAFDATSESFETIDTVLPYATSGMTAVAVDDKIYLIGGTYDDDSYYQLLYVFNPADHTIKSTAKKMSAACAHVAATTIDSTICIFGGDSGSSWTSQTGVYDTIANTMRTNPVSFPSTGFAGSSCYGSEIASCAVGRTVFLFGGGVRDDVYLDTVCAFHLDSMEFATAHAYLPLGVRGMKAVAVGKKIYLFGGMDGNSNYLDTIYILDTEQFLFPNNLCILSDEGRDKYKLITSDVITVETGIDNMYVGSASGVGKQVSFSQYKDGIWQVCPISNN